MRFICLLLAYIILIPSQIGLAKTPEEVRLRCKNDDKLKVLARKGIISNRLCMSFKEDKLRVYLRGLVFDLAKYKHAKANDLQNVSTEISDKMYQLKFQIKKVLTLLINIIRTKLAKDKLHLKR